jgi:hypothetical protein
VNIIINAVDARSVAQLISAPESQNVITQSVRRALHGDVGTRREVRSV